MNFARALRFLVPVVGLGGLFPIAASAAPVPAPSAACTVDSVTINKIEKSPLDGSGIIYSGSQNATKCVGLLPGNDSQAPYNKHNPNIGQFEDGLLNGQGGVLSPTWFNDPSNPSPMLDLDNNGSHTDPGWIYLGKGDREGKATSFDLIPWEKPLDLSSVLNIKFACTNGDGGCTKGTWALETSLDIIQQVQAALGRNSFDHLAFVLKSSTDFAIYDFDFNMLSAGLPGFDFTTPYSFTGTWNTDDFVNKKGKAQDISHISVWARDPVPEDVPNNEVPEPGALFLVALGLLGTGVAHRRRV